jgi:hypothetical protein
VCFPVNATLKSESDLYQLSYLSLPIHTSANAAQAGGRVELTGYSVTVIRYVIVKTSQYSILSIPETFIRPWEIQTRTGFFFRKVTYTGYDVTYFVKRMDFTKQMTWVSLSV